MASRPAALLLAAAMVVLGACASSGDDGAATSTSRTSTTRASASTTQPVGDGCRGGSAAIPAAAVSQEVGDVDGDGRPDTAWLAFDDMESSAVTFGIVTAAGGGSSTPFSSASPVERSALVVDVDEQGPVEIILSDGRGASLYAFADCALAPVRNPQGETYAFDLGNRIGTGSGIGCADTSVGRRLVGLDREPSDDGITVAWTQTVVQLDGLTARNGTRTRGTYRRPADADQIQRLDDITCGDATMRDDGLTLR